jgi:hypothetical protein
MGISLNPQDAVAGGLLDDANVKWTEASFVMWDYGGKSDQPVPALCVKMEDENGEEHEQYWSIGRAQDWAPSEDGKELVAVGQKTSLNSNSNAMILLESLINAGFPADQLGERIDILEGLKAHMIRVAAPSRPGLDSQQQGQQKTILTVDEILQLPWESGKSSKGSKGNKGGKGGGKSAASSGGQSGGGSDEEALKEKATSTIMEVLGEEGSVEKKNLPNKIFAKLKQDADRNEIVKLAYKDEYLQDGPWTYENGTLSME